MTVIDMHLSTYPLRSSEGNTTEGGGGARCPHVQEWWKALQWCQVTFGWGGSGATRGVHLGAAEVAGRAIRPSTVRVYIVVSTVTSRR